MKDAIPSLLRLVLSAVFIYAGVLKLLDPLALADSIAGFRLLPVWAINPFATGLPVYEVLLGLLLLTPRWRRPAALGITLLCVLFAGALSLALVRGIPIDCGCFGKSAWASNPWLLLARDAALLVAATWLYARDSRLNERAQTPRPS